MRKFCCTSVSSSRCMSFSMRALHSSECGFVTFCVPATRVVQASHSGVGPYCATSSFRMYLRPLLWRSNDCLRFRHHYCRHWRWSHLRLFTDEHPRNSLTFSDEFIVPLLDNNRFHPNPRSHPVKKAGVWTFMLFSGTCVAARPQCVCICTPKLSLGIFLAQGVVDSNFWQLSFRDNRMWRCTSSTCDTMFAP